jgi:hypothetical protein
VDRASRHFHRRLLQRTGFVLAYGEYAALCRAIRQGRADKVRADGKRSGYYAVPFRGGTLLLLWGAGQPRTALHFRRPDRPLVEPGLTDSDVMGPSPDEGDARRHMERNMQETGTASTGSGAGCG